MTKTFLRTAFSEVEVAILTNPVSIIMDKLDVSVQKQNKNPMDSFKQFWHGRVELRAELLRNSTAL